MNNKSKNNELDLEVLTALISSSKVEDKDLFSFTNSIACYSLSFYKEYDTDNVIVEDFGLMVNDKFQQLEPTPFQLELMQTKIDRLIESETVVEEDCDEFESTKCFVIANFHTIY
jgi:hypothetical protein